MSNIAGVHFSKIPPPSTINEEIKKALIVFDCIWFCYPCEESIITIIIVIIIMVNIKYLLFEKFCPEYDKFSFTAGQ